MKYQLIFTRTYNKKAANFLKLHPNLLNQYEKTIELLEINPKHPSLRLHKLKGKLSHLYSISINLSYRIIFQFLLKDNQIILIDVGDHSQVY
jgi:proteic killer suppression protein